MGDGLIGLSFKVHSFDMVFKPRDLWVAQKLW